MGKRMDKEREEKLQPLRVKYAKEELLKLGFDLSFEDETTIKFDFKGNTITFFPYSGWFSGKGIKDGSGINKLLKRLNYKPMKKMYLQKMTDFVLNEKIQDTADKDAAEIYQSYARFLQKSLTLGMFIPCDENENILKIPSKDQPIELFFEEQKKYFEAKEKVLFKGFELIGYVDNTAASSLWIFKYKNHKRYSIEHSFKGDRLNIESLISRFRDDYELTESAIKEIGL